MHILYEYKGKDQLHPDSSDPLSCCSNVTKIRNSTKICTLRYSMRRLKGVQYSPFYSCFMDDSPPITDEKKIRTIENGNISMFYSHFLSECVMHSNDDRLLYNHLLSRKEDA